MALPERSRPAASGRPEAGVDTQLVRHLLFNPLSVVRGSAQTLLARDLEPSVRSQLLEAIVASSTDIERVLLDLLEPARPPQLRRLRETAPAREERIRSRVQT
ncbi:MAG TPA: histidine kinase dimerization/phospho-acceptor domain-containing protein [Gaiellaceae bacterium]|jgi:signal transduction histidine kinase|nr:histidine kinase dimerization/phospho-acceptor domain-containing protein [Gaiellaceae bacterium]